MYSEIRLNTNHILSFHVDIYIIKGPDAFTPEQSTELFLKMKFNILKSKRFVDV